MNTRIIALAVTLIGAGLLAQMTKTRPADGDWPMYSRDLAGTRYSPLTQINTENVARLTQAWSVRLTAPAGGRGGPPAAAPEETDAAPAPAGRSAGVAPD